MPMSPELRNELLEVTEALPDGNVRALIDVLKSLGPDRPLRRWPSLLDKMSDEDTALIIRLSEEGRYGEAAA